MQLSKVLKPDTEMKRLRTVGAGAQFRLDPPNYEVDDITAPAVGDVFGVIIPIPEEPADDVEAELADRKSVV